MSASALYRLWIQGYTDTDQCRIVELEYHQFRGVWKCLMALALDINAIIELDNGQRNPRRPNMRYSPIRGDYFAFFNPIDLNTKTLYQISKCAITSKLRGDPRLWVLFKNPFRNAQTAKTAGISNDYGSHFIIPFKHQEELKGIYTVFEWLNLDPLDYCLRIEDNHGNLMI